MSGNPAPRLRSEGGHDRSQVGMVELFFDLVFVFAITQLSHGLLEQLTPLGALHTAVLFIGAWWLWIYTTWCTNWLNPASTSVRQLLFVLMLLALVMAAALPRAFDDRGLLFALAYVVQQLLRSTYMVRAFGARSAHGRNFIRIVVWLAASGCCWILGGLADPQARLAWWAAAIAIEFMGPIAYFRTPGLGASTTTDWDVDPHHMAERCGLFVIIALGESLLITGATFAGLAWETQHLLAFLAAFVGTVAMWWLYFDTGSERAMHHFEHAADRGRVARLAYTYLHIPIVAGIILCAVADELVLVHPDHASDAGIAVILGGPFLYLLGNGLFKWVTNRRRLPPVSHLAGMAMLMALAPFAFGHAFSALALGGLTTGTLVLVALWEWWALQPA
jgi:low temperature requirement protein LtrA